MADLSISAAAVVQGADAIIVSGQAGETIAAGKAVYLNSTTNKYMLADADGATAEAKTATGMALNSASLNQPIDVQRSGDITLGAVLTAGVAYYLSGTPGGVCPVADVGAGENVCLLGLAESTTVLHLDIQAPGVSN